MGKRVMLDMSGASAETVATTATFATIKPMHEKLTVIAMLIVTVAEQLGEDPAVVAMKLAGVIASAKKEGEKDGKSLRN